LLQKRRDLDEKIRAISKISEALPEGRKLSNAKTRKSSKRRDRQKKELDKKLVREKKKLMVTVEQFLKWKILPRCMMLASTIMSWRCAEWFMELRCTNSSTVSFVSVVMGVMTGVFGIWMGHEHKGETNVISVDRTNSKSR
jgi:hypothetical protein